MLTNTLPKLFICSSSSMSKYKLSVFIFRRDHRLNDNTGLLKALISSTQVFPCFIFDTLQIDPNINPYFSNNCVQFMVESLRDLNTQLDSRNSRLFCFHGKIETVIDHIIGTVKPNALYVNQDVTPYSITRDKKISDICAASSVDFHSYEDIMILPLKEVLMPDGNPFQFYTPYYKEVVKHQVQEPVKNTFTNYCPVSMKVQGELPISEIGKFYVENPNVQVHGGYTNGMRILGDIQKFKTYQKDRRSPAGQTTLLSAYNKFGCVSIREVYHTVKKAFGKNHKLMKYLFWRDFYYYYTYFNPHVFGRY